jgi:hypothetical protein
MKRYLVGGSAALLTAASLLTTAPPAAARGDKGAFPGGGRFGAVTRRKELGSDRRQPLADDACAVRSS